MNRKVKSFKQRFYRNSVRYRSYNNCSKSSLSALTQVHNCFPTNTLLEVSPEIRCSGASSH